MFKMNIELKLFLLADLSSKTKIDRAVEAIEGCIISTSNTCLPRYTTVPVRKLPWINEELKRAKTDLQTSYKRWKRSLTELGRQYNQEEYIKAKRKYKKLFHSKRRDSWRAVCERAAAGSAFQIFKSVKPTNKSAISTIRIDEQNYTQDYTDTLTHLINTHFPNSNHPPLQQPTHRLTERELNEIQLTNDREIGKAFQGMSSGKAPGSDGINSAIILNCLDVVPDLFTNLFNAMMQTGHFPERWKTATVCMIPKPGKTEITAKAFRPISLIKIVAKALEKILNSRLILFLHSNSRISPRQFGFVRRRSTIDA